MGQFSNDLAVFLSERGYVEHTPPFDSDKKRFFQKWNGDFGINVDVWEYRVRVPKEELHTSVEVDLNMQDVDKWWTFKVYAFDVDKFKENLSKYEEKLVKAWLAAKD